MATTIMLQQPTHERLLDLKRRLGRRSMDAVVQHLLGKAASAAEIYEARKDEVDAACEQWGITVLVAFGSRARGDARSDSDLDLAFRTERRLGWDIVELEADLARAFGLRVDARIMPDGDWNRRLRDEIERDGVVLIGG